MKIQDRDIFLIVVTLFCSLILILILGESPKRPLLSAQNVPHASEPVALERKEAEMNFFVEDQELIVFVYHGHNSIAEQIKSYFMLFSSGNIIYWRYHGRGAYLYNYKTDNWIFAHLTSQQKSLVKPFHFSLQQINLHLDNTYNDNDCKQLQFYDPFWESFYDTCLITLSKAIKRFGDEETKLFQEKFLSRKSLGPITKLSGFHGFIEDEFVFMHRWFYLSDKKFDRNLDLQSIQHFERLSDARSKLELNVPMLHLFENSKYLPTCKAFEC